MHNHKVTIITPIYNVAKYIERCAVSLFEQDFEDIEYIFVNDCTPDNSIGILQRVIEKYLNRKPNVKIIHHKENKGLGSARNTGLAKAKGEYILHLDSDDWVELDMVSSLYNKAKETDADIVACDVFFESKNRHILKQEYSENRENNISKLLTMELLPNVGNKLMRLDLYKKYHISAPLNIVYSEDKYLILRIAFFANKIAYVPKVFYHYRQNNENSLTKKPQSRVFSDLRRYLETTKGFLQEQNEWEKYKDFLFIDIVAETITYSIRRSENICKNLNFVVPEINKIQTFKYLWRCPYWGRKVKIKYSLFLLKLEKPILFLLKMLRKDEKR